MDIESFYEQNEARRESAEFEFGSEWTDSSGQRIRVVVGGSDRGALPDGGARCRRHRRHLRRLSRVEEPVNDLTVVVIGKVPSLAGLEDLLEGWEEAMLEENSLVWLRERLPEQT